MTITKFDPSTLRPLRAEMEDALAEVAERHGLKFQLGKMTYDMTGQTFTAKVTAETGGGDERKRAEAVGLAKMYGFDASEPSTHERTKGAVLVEFMATRTSRPWCYEMGGKRYITDERSVKIMWPPCAGPDLVEVEAPTLAR